MLRAADALISRGLWTFIMSNTLDLGQLLNKSIAAASVTACLIVSAAVTVTVTVGASTASTIHQLATGCNSLARRWATASASGTGSGTSGPSTGPTSRYRESSVRD